MMINPPKNNHDDIADFLSYDEALELVNQITQRIKEEYKMNQKLYNEGEGPFEWNEDDVIVDTLNPNHNAIEIIKTLIESLQHDPEYIEETRSRWYDEVVAKIEILNVVLSLLKVEDE